MRVLFRLVPENTSVPFLKWRRAAFILSAALIALSVLLVTLPTRSCFGQEGFGSCWADGALNLGIDFRGGTLIEIETPQPVDQGSVETTLRDLGLGDVRVQEFGSDTDLLVRIERQPGTGVEGERAQQEAAERARAALRELVPGVDFRRTEVVGGVVSAELAQKGTLAITIALAAMLLYIWMRFDGWQFSVGAVAALAHDVVLTIGMFALTRIEFNLSIIAAILTIVGYSMNDTVVVYDRIRENMRKYKKMELSELLQLSINNTLSRTVVTSVTTLIALLALFFLGGEVLRGFAFAMIWGVIVGTYSSVFIAAPILLYTGVRSKPAEDETAPAQA